MSQGSAISVSVDEQRILRDRGKKRRIGVEAPLGAAEHGREVEAEAVDAGRFRPMAHRIDDEPHDRRLVERQRVAAAGVVDEPAGIVGGVAVIERVVEAAQRQRRAEHVAFAGVVEDDIEDDADAGLVQRGDRRLRVRRCRPAQAADRAP